MEAERLLYMFAMILPAFGLVRLVWERKLEVSRKAVTGTNAFSSTVLGGIVGTGALWKLTGSYIYAARLCGDYRCMLRGHLRGCEKEGISGGRTVYEGRVILGNMESD